MYRVWSVTTNVGFRSKGVSCRIICCGADGLRPKRSGPFLILENSIDFPGASVLVLKVNAPGNTSYLLSIVTLWQK